MLDSSLSKKAMSIMREWSPSEPRPVDWMKCSVPSVLEASESLAPLTEAEAKEQLEIKRAREDMLARFGGQEIPGHRKTRSEADQK